ncbi:uncharacterized protein LOC62_07G009303 [Vanrija pseudolonga]|uniref:Uncharacterized protein n=1 Tax=Vanrija pseudolonga TaxID=143232 RepID=A0AAF0YHN7_9TREE|nr:hypothetical protein LOC62_07G009303 [Vanrija pseudolonga]
MCTWRTRKRFGIPTRIRIADCLDPRCPYSDFKDERRGRGPDRGGNGSRGGGRGGRGGRGGGKGGGHLNLAGVKYWLGFRSRR